VRLWYRPAFVRRLARLQARLLVLALFCAICGVVGAASGAGSSNASRQRVGALRHENATLARSIDGAILNLYALDSKLQVIRAQLTSVNTKREQIAREQLSVQLQLNASRHNFRSSQRQLALVVHALYEQQASDPLAVMLGAESLEEALATLDDLGRAAQQNRQIATRSREAQTSFQILRSTLERKAATIRALELATSREAASLEAAKGTHRQYVSSLVAQRHLNLAQVSRIEARAHASATASHEIAAQTIPVSSASAATTAPGDHTITVVATGYASGGTTATGLPVGWGTVAVDPAVIPLGTRMTIPGYGQGVAADTGSAVRGATVDLWFPTMRQALAWGRRVVTVTLH
jgi:3D (Asp-Asp-Asp) domain-containing protein